MRQFQRPGKDVATGHAPPARMPEPERRERTPEQRAADATTIAGNIAALEQAIAGRVLAMQRAAAAGDRAGWAAARQAADVAVSQLAMMVGGAAQAANQATDEQTRMRLAGAEAAHASAARRVGEAPEAPSARAPVVSCAGDLLAVLMPAKHGDELDAVFKASEQAVRNIFWTRMSRTDIEAFHAILRDHRGDELAVRFARFSPERQQRLLDVFRRPEVIANSVRLHNARLADTRRTAATMPTTGVAALGSASGGSVTSANAVIAVDSDVVGADAQPAVSAPLAVAGATTAPIQRQEAAPTAPKKPKQRIPYMIQVTKRMTGEEFKATADRQVFGAVLDSDWSGVKDVYTADDSPVEILIDAALFHRGRGVANTARGIDSEVTGEVVGADARATEFQSAPGSAEKSALLAEIDRRYYAASGEAAGSKVRPGDHGHAELWRSIRDEVLFQGAYLANLPEKVRTVIRTGITGRDLAPADYDQLFRIAKKIENLPAGQAADYASKVTAQATTIAELEASLESYSGGIAAREQQNQDRAAAHNKLVGLEPVYALYRTYRATPSEAMPPGMRDQLERLLHRHGFTSIAELVACVSKYEQAFEDSAAAITFDILAKYAGKLHRESERYRDPSVVKALHGKLAGFRTQHQAFEKNSKIQGAEEWKALHTRDAEVRRLPGNGAMPAKPPTRERTEAKQRAEAAKANAEAQIKDLSAEYPVFAEDELPADKRLNKVALAQAGEAELAGVLQAHIANRQVAVAEARGQVESKHDLVYNMSKLMPAFYAQLGIQPGSIHDQILQDKMHGDAVAKVVTGIAVAIVTVALTVVSLGTTTPAVLAAGASIVAAGISAPMAYDEYKNYTEEHGLAEVGFADDPSATWLVLAVVGAGVDMASAVSAVGKLASVAKGLDAAVNAEGKLLEFTAAVEKLRKSGELGDQAAAAANRAGAARTSYAAAKSQFKADLQAAAKGAHGTLGPFTDPTVFRALVKMAIAKIREGIHTLDGFIAELKQARIEAQLAELAPEDLAKVKEAWAQAESLGKELAPSAERLAELKRALRPLLPQANEVSAQTLVMLDKLDKSVLPKLRVAEVADLDRLGQLLIEEPSLAERLVNSNNPYGALRKAQTVRQMDSALFTERLVDLKVSPTRIRAAADKSGIAAADLAKLTDADLGALGNGDRLIAEARQGFGPSEADLGKLALAQAEFDKIAGVATGTRNELRAAVAHQHGLSDLPFMRNPGEALAAKLPNLPKSSMEALVKRHPDALRALENASKPDLEAVARLLQSSENPKDIEDILRSYMYKAQKGARKSGTGLDVPHNVGSRIEESLENLAQARKQGHPFGFKDKAQYDQFISTVDSEISSRGINGKAKVQGSAMHSKTPGDIDMEIVVSQSEFDRLAKQFIANARDESAKSALKVSISKNKVPSYQFYPQDDPSVARAVKKFTQGAGGKELEVQATLIVQGSDFDLGPFL